MLGWLRGIAEGIENLGNNITSGITDALVAVFVPSEDFLTDKMDYISRKFGFVTTLFEIIEIILAGFNAGNELKPPVVTMNLGNATSKYFYGGECVVLDLSWYAPYKPVVDIFLRSVLWVFFLWRLFVALPNIINGIAGSGSYIGKGMAGSDVPKIGMKRR